MRHTILGAAMAATCSLFICGSAFAVCVNPNIIPLPTEPSVPIEIETNRDEFIKYINSAAYAAFLEKKCFSESSIHNNFESAIGTVVPDASTQVDLAYKLSEFEALHAKNSSFIGTFKRCTISTGDTRDLIAQSNGKIRRHLTLASKLSLEFSAKKKAWDAQVAERDAQNKEYQTCVAQEDAVRINQVVVEATPKLGRKIVASAYNGGTNIGTSLRAWSFDRLTRRYTFNVSITWSGAIFASHSYCADGIVIMDDDGNVLDWNPTYLCQSLKDYLGDRALWGGAAAIGAILLEANAK